MARKSKCKGCEVEITKEEKYIYSNKTYCQNCYDKIQAEKQDYNLLIKTICEYFNIEVPTGLILKQIKQFKEELKYSHAGITYTLWYIKAIENKNLEVKYGIALIKFYYEKAKSYFEQQQKISDSATNVSLNEIKLNKVTINLNKVYNKKNNFLINIDDLLGGNN